AKITAGGPGVAFPTTLAVTPTEVAPGGTVTATWAGIPVPTAGDYLLLFPLGADTESYVDYWLTGGGGAGALALALSAALPAGAYELRLLSPDPNYGGPLAPLPRTRPASLRVAAAPAVGLAVPGGAVT